MFIVFVLQELSVLSDDTQITGLWPSNMIFSLERNANELEKLLKQNINDCLYFHSLNGVSLLTKLLSRILNGNKEKPTSLTDRANVRLTNLLQIMCSQKFDVSDYVIHSNNMILLLDILSHRINV